LRSAKEVKVIRGEDLSLNDREVDLDRIEPTGVGRGVDEDCMGPLGVEAVGSPLAPMDGAVAHDPEDAPRGLVGLLVHAFVNEAIHCGDAIWGLTTTEDLGAVEIPSHQVGPDAAAPILVFHSRGWVRRGRQVGCFRRRAGMLVFSSAEISQSSALNGAPCQTRWYRSRTGATLAA
jgi:hypothetical protein